MKKSKALVAGLILGTAAITLTACDPPMPPEVAAALAEQTYTCIEGNANVSAPDAMADLMWGWIDSLNYACVDPEPVMTATSVLTADTPDIEITAGAPACNPSATVPFAVDAAVLVYMESEVNALSISPKSIAGIMDGTITNWKQLAKDNPGYEMPDFPISIVPAADEFALAAMTGYLKDQGIKANNKVFEASAETTVDQYSLLEEGQIALVPNSYAVYLGLYPASIYLGQDADEFPILATPDVSGMQSASTQWVMETGDTGISVKLDKSKKPTPPEGSDFAPVPYQAIYPVNMNVCEPGNLVSRAVGRFLLRLDSQGALAASNYAPIPEFVRISALLKVSTGLPTPTPTPTE
jgi:hypothetical protein